MINKQQVLHTSRCISASPTSLPHSLQSSQHGCTISWIECWAVGWKSRTLWSRWPLLNVTVAQLLLSLPVLPHPPVPRCLSSQLLSAAPRPFAAGRAPLWGHGSCQQNKNDYVFNFIPSCQPRLCHWRRCSCSSVWLSCTSTRCQIRWKCFFHAYSQHSYANET